MRFIATISLGLAIAGGLSLPAAADGRTGNVRAVPPPMSGMMFFVPYEGPSGTKVESTAEQSPALRPAPGPVSEPATSQPAGVLTAVKTPAASPEAQASADAYYLVVRSYDDRAEAAQAAQQLAPVAARIATAEVRGRTWYRVYVGPLPPHDAARHRARLARAGFGDAWGIRACPVDRVGPDCLALR